MGSILISCSVAAFFFSELEGGEREWSIRERERENLLVVSIDQLLPDWN